jgi:pyruvate dehydrogenase E2 component (dihydrolipoamide acetyltransferase)
LAEDNGIDLAMIRGTGPEGRIVEDDVKAAIAHKAQAPSAASAPTTDRIARAKAERVSQSWRTIPHFHMSITADMTNVVQRKAAASANVTYTDLLALALAQTLAQNPALNGHWLNDAPALSAEIRLGIVVQTERGLVIPATHDLRGRSLDDIAAERALLVQQAHSGKLGSSAMVEPTFTLSNVGPGHIDSFAAIISPPQLAILAAGSIQPRPWVIGVDGKGAEPTLALRSIATFTLGVDHRAIDGRQAAAFLEQLKTHLETM